MKCLVTGATGLIGSRLVRELLEQEYDVNVLVRSPQKLPEGIRRRVNVFQGDLMDKESIGKAMIGCNAVFHVAAYTGIWSKDKMIHFRVNVTGTRNILESALNNDVGKVVYTSSAGTLSPSEGAVPVDENTPMPDNYTTGYDFSKRQAEQLCDEFGRLGLRIVVVNPTRVYGPGPLNKSNSIALIIKKYFEGKWRFIPGDGSCTGNYAFVGDVAAGHVLALKNGIPGERYILGGANVSFNEFFSRLAQVSGKKRHLIHVPFPLISALSEMELFMAEYFGRYPLLTPEWAKRYRQHRLVSSGKAITRLGYTITILPEALQQTIDWLRMDR